MRARVEKRSVLGWNKSDAGTQFTLTDFKEECQTRGVHLTLAAPEHQEMNGQVEVTWRTLLTFAHALMVHARVPEVYVHFAFMYTRYPFWCCGIPTKMPRNPFCAW